MAQSIIHQKFALLTHRMAKKKTGRNTEQHKEKVSFVCIEDAFFYGGITFLIVSVAEWVINNIVDR